MPRRRNGKAQPGGKNPRGVKRSDSTVKKWNTRSDIPLDEVDQFHSSRDQILLEGGDDGFERDDDDDEVFALRGMAEDEDEDQNEFVADDSAQEDEDLPSAGKQQKKYLKIKEKKKTGKDQPSSSSEEEEEEGWGRGKTAYYASNADELESDDEEGQELEEQEAKRLQAKTRENTGDEDFGLKDGIEIQKDDTDVIADYPSAVNVTLPKDKKSLIRHLEKTSPEALALARDWEDTADALVRTRKKIEEIESDAPSLGILHLHYQTLLSYTTTLAFYFHLRASEKYAQRPALLQSHPIMQRLLTLKQALITLEDLDFAVTDDEDEDNEDEDDADMKWDAILKDGQMLWRDDDEMNELDEDELADLIEDAQKPSKISSKLQEAKAKPPPKKKRKVAKEELKAPLPVFDLVEPEFIPSRNRSSTHKQQDTSDTYGESSFLQDTDVADKNARKKSLRFHTSKIESASARRQGARAQAVGGDDDLPYREKKKEKDARAEREAKNRVAKQGGADLDDVDPELPTEKRKRQDDDSDGGESPDDYYELVQKQSKEKKLKKRGGYEEARIAAKPDFSQGDAVGPRSLTRAILANKGLTPHRPKSVRNPRVKKRQKFEKAKKKLSSQKAVYKGGISESGRYDGERSGISKVVKSVRLG